MVLMNSLVDFALRERYAGVRQRRPRLEQMKKLIDWDAFRKFLPAQPVGSGRRRLDQIMMLRCLLLQEWYTISDEELEFQIADRLSFQEFLEFPKQPPDHTTIWRFREALADGDTIDEIWAELHRQLSAHGITVSKGKVQDASFVTADPGKTRSGKDGRGREAATSRQADATWTKKNQKSVFGYKQHTKMDLKHKLIVAVATTTASTHDNQIDLAEEDEVIYRDKAYMGAPTRARGDATMRRATRGHSLSARDKLRNKRISKQRVRGEHPFGTMHRVFHAGHTRVTTLWRVHTHNVFSCIAYNIHRLFTILDVA